MTWTLRSWTGEAMCCAMEGSGLEASHDVEGTGKIRKRFGVVGGWRGEEGSLVRWMGRETGTWDGLGKGKGVMALGGR